MPLTREPLSSLKAHGSRCRARWFAVLVVLATLASCTPSDREAAGPSVGPPAASTISGQVLSLDGSPVRGAGVEEIGQGARTTTEADGTFSIPEPPEGWLQRGVWVRVSGGGFLARTLAAEVGSPVLVRLTPDDGHTISIRFGGDVMTGRRFYDPNEDGDPSDGLIPPDASVAEEAALFENIRPLFSDSDISVINLETPLMEHPYFAANAPRPERFHPTKEYAFASSISLAQAMADVGVDVVDIGNNHLYDGLEKGTASTLDALTQAGFGQGQGRFGGGLNEKEAWQPAYVTAGDQRVAFLGCTGVVLPIKETGRQIPGEVHGHVQKNAIGYAASATKGGAAACDEDRISRAVAKAKDHSDLVVFMVHSGLEYWRLPSANVVSWSRAAHRAGAAIVAGGHPHVVSGFSVTRRSIIAWSMGNFLIDQLVWPTFESYVLTVDVRDGKVIRAYTDPMMVQDFIPEGVTGSLADYVARGAAGWIQVPSAIEGGTTEIDLTGRATERITKVPVPPGGPDGQVFHLGPGSWVSDLEGSGDLRLGRDLLWVGSFEDSDVDAVPAEAPLWSFETGAEAGPSYAFQGDAGVRMSRSGGDCYDALVSPTHRILTEPGKQVSLVGMSRVPVGAEARVQLSWYRRRKGGSFRRSVRVLPSTGGRWEPFRVDATVPDRAVAVGPYLRLVPPDTGSSYADFDDLALVEWAPRGTPPSPVYDYALVHGRGTLSVRNDAFPGAPGWDRETAIQEVDEGSVPPSPAPRPTLRPDHCS